MKKLVGSEKQVSWAEDIRAGYAETAEILKEVVSIYSDTTQKEVVEHDPLFGDEVMTVYEKEVDSTGNLPAATTRACHWKPAEAGKEWSWMNSREQEIGGEHAERLARRDFYAATLKNLEKALADEDDARYWIDRR